LADEPTAVWSWLRPRVTSSPSAASVTNVAQRRRALRRLLMAASARRLLLKSRSACRGDGRMRYLRFASTAATTTRPSCLRYTHAQGPSPVRRQS